jgi:hypothetical protein
MLLLPLHAPQHSREPTPALRREPRMQRLLITPIRDVNPLIPRQRMRLHRPRRRYAVFPLLLHLRMHHQQRVMREQNRDLALRVRHLPARFVTISRHDSAHAKLPPHAETKTPDHGARAEVGQVVGVEADALAGAVVDVYEGGVGAPGVGGLVA